MRIYPAVHYTMGGLWVDYNLMSTIPGLHVIGEANFSDHGANRLGASALMQGLADGYFVVPLHDRRLPRIEQARAGRRADNPEVRRDGSGGARAHGAAPRRQGQAHGRVVPSRARQDRCGSTAAWRATRRGLTKALEIIPQACARSSGRDVRMPGSGAELNQSLEHAGRVADFFELAELMCLDALHREESCGGHFRVEHQTPDGEALRDDEQFAYAAAWEYAGEGKAPIAEQGAAGVRERRAVAAQVQVGARRLAMNLTLHVWRQAVGERAGNDGALRGARHQPGHVVPRDARRRQRAADRERADADRVRSRLPRGHLRLVRHDDQRRRARPA